jgi:transcriptional regulator with PAS, ATPase and Fis domain
MIYGETGTGKELFAKAIHDASSRKDKKYYAINCAALPSQLLESELFGTVEGAYTGAVDKEGILEMLDGGTLFLDELEACPAEVQVKLLRVLQPPIGKAMTCRCFARLGSDEELKSDVRIIAATNEHLKNGDFRTDLFNRIATLTVTLPSLRIRQNEVSLLAEKLFNSIKRELGSAFNNKELGESAINFIESRAWFGNVRELKNALTQAIVFSETNEITEVDFDQSLPPKSAFTDVGNDELDLSKGIDLKAVIDKETIRLQKKYVEKALIITKGNKIQAAKLLGITYQTIDNWKKGWEENDEK